MFWIGFVSIYVIMGVLILMMSGSEKLLKKMEVFFKNAKIVGCTIVFTLLSFVFTLFYSMVAMVSSNAMTNALLCTILLIFSWFIVEKMYQKISGEGVDSEDKGKIVLTKEDKNVCNLWALLGVIVSSILLYLQNQSSEYFILVSIAISIWIGAYIPISEIYKGRKVKTIAIIVAKEFKTKKTIVWITAILCVLFIVFLVLENNVAEKLNTLLEEVGKGIVCGSLVMILVLMLWGVIKKKK